MVFERIQHLIEHEPNENAIMVEHLSKRFRIPHERKITLYQHMAGLFHGRSYSYEEFAALQNVSFTVKHGETFGIIGPNGSGKSTLLKILAHVMYPDSGSVKVNGKIAPFLELGVGFQPDLTAKENIYLYSAIMGLSKKEVALKYDEILDFAELKRFESMKLKNFSSGMAVRLAFSTAIQTNPEILLVDEVLSVGDASFQGKCYDKINEFRSEGKTIVYVSHGLETVKQLCERSILLDHGQVISSGFTEKVINDYHIMMRKREEVLLKEHQAEIAEQRKTEIIEEQNQKDMGTEKIQANRWGSHEIEITEVKILDKNGDERYFFNTGEKLTVQIKYHANKPIKNPTFGVAIFRNDGIYVYGSNTQVDHLFFGTVDGDGIISLTYNELNLLNGTFFLDVAIYDEHCKNSYDYLKQTYCFKVKDDTGNEGICNINHKYEAERV